MARDKNYISYSTHLFIMVNIGLFGVSEKKTHLLKLLIKWIEKHSNGSVPRKGNSEFPEFKVIKMDFSGVAHNEVRGIKEEKTIHPVRVLVENRKTGKKDTFFAPGGDIKRALVKMGIITISRIAREAIVIFDTTLDLDLQFAFLEQITLPTEIYIHMIAPNNEDLNTWSNKKSIKEYFENRRIKIRKILGEVLDYTISLEDYDGYSQQKDDSVPQLLLLLTKELGVKELYSSKIKKITTESCGCAELFTY